MSFIYRQPKDLPKHLDVEGARQHSRFTRTTLFRIAVGVLAAVILLVNLFTHVIPIVRYYGDGMEPSLRGGQTLVLLKTQNVKEGDVIAFYYNNKVLVRRVICEGGEQVTIENDGTVSVNGRELEEPYLNEKSIGQCNLTFPYYVQNGHVFVLGDNRSIAMDSRLAEIGTVPLERIVGKVLLKF